MLNKHLRSPYWVLANKQDTTASITLIINTKFWKLTVTDSSTCVQEMGGTGTTDLQ